MTIHEFHPPPGTIQTHASIEIAAPPEQVAAVYLDVSRWQDLYPKTIASARMVATSENWIQVEVQHRFEGVVPNELVLITPLKIGLFESKHKFDAWFLNEFLPAGRDRTTYALTSYIRPKGIYRLLRPFLVGYIHRQSLAQMQNDVLQPIKQAVEQPVVVQG